MSASIETLTQYLTVHSYTASFTCLDTLQSSISHILHITTQNPSWLQGFTAYMCLCVRMYVNALQCLQYVFFSDTCYSRAYTWMRPSFVPDNIELYPQCVFCCNCNCNSSPDLTAFFYRFCRSDYHESFFALLYYSSMVWSNMNVLCLNHYCITFIHFYTWHIANTNV